ncbi:hypothetical protein HPB48_013875 [Haemaphysalis longicornis]|uniref:Uncharacterized protein n=1 Tax=Haemaphysalis longicornis TaxID=44386 RepID=A0A9J6FUL6_HAELO|nr:hypothetical protein HPB48_013875 [Haemaphysalis longicornis]
MAGRQPYSDRAMADEAAFLRPKRSRQALEVTHDSPHGFFLTDECNSVPENQCSSAGEKEMSKSWVPQPSDQGRFPTPARSASCTYSTETSPLPGGGSPAPATIATNSSPSMPQSQALPLLRESLPSANNSEDGCTNNQNPESSKSLHFGNDCSAGVLHAMKDLFPNREDPNAKTDGEMRVVGRSSTIKLLENPRVTYGGWGDKSSSNVVTAFPMYKARALLKLSASCNANHNVPTLTEQPRKRGGSFRRRSPFRVPVFGGSTRRKGTRSQRRFLRPGEDGEQLSRENLAAKSSPRISRPRSMSRSRRQCSPLPGSRQRDVALQVHEMRNVCDVVDNLVKEFEQRPILKPLPPQTPLSKSVSRARSLSSPLYGYKKRHLQLPYDRRSASRLRGHVALAFHSTSESESSSGSGKELEGISRLCSLLESITGHLKPEAQLLHVPEARSPAFREEVGSGGSKDHLRRKTKTPEFPIKPGTSRRRRYVRRPWARKERSQRDDTLLEPSMDGHHQRQLTERMLYVESYSAGTEMDATGTSISDVTYQSSTDAELSSKARGKVAHYTKGPKKEEVQCLTNLVVRDRNSEGDRLSNLELKQLRDNAGNQSEAADAASPSRFSGRSHYRPRENMSDRTQGSTRKLDQPAEISRVESFGSSPQGNEYLQNSRKLIYRKDERRYSTDPEQKSSTESSLRSGDYFEQIALRQSRSTLDDSASKQSDRMQKPHQLDKPHWSSLVEPVAQNLPLGSAGNLPYGKQHSAYKGSGAAKLPNCQASPPVAPSRVNSASCGASFVTALYAAETGPDFDRSTAETPPAQLMAPTMASTTGALALVQPQDTPILPQSRRPQSNRPESLQGPSFVEDESSYAMQSGEMNQSSVVSDLKARSRYKMYGPERRSSSLDHWDQESTPPRTNSTEAIMSRALPQFNLGFMENFRRSGSIVLYITLVAGILAGIIAGFSVHMNSSASLDDTQDVGGADNVAQSPMYSPLFEREFGLAAKPTSCHNPSCSEQVAHLVRSLDASVRPCRNFYGHVCSLRQANGTADDQLVQRSVSKVVAFFKGIGSPDRDFPVAAASRRFWRDCVDLTTLSRVGKAPLQALLKLNGLSEWPYVAGNGGAAALPDIWKTAGQLLRRMALSPLVGVSVTNTDTLQLIRGDLHSGSGEADDVLEAMLMLRRNSSRLREVAADVAALGRQLNGLLDRQPPPASPEDEKDLVPFLENAVKGLGFVDAAVVHIQPASFLGPLLELLHSTEPQTVLNLLGYQLVRHVDLFTPSAVKADLYSGAVSGRESQCAHTVLETALTGDEAEYVRYAALRNQLDFDLVRSMVEQLKHALVAKLPGLRWFDTNALRETQRRLRELKTLYVRLSVVDTRDPDSPLWPVLQVAHMGPRVSRCLLDLLVPPSLHGVHRSQMVNWSSAAHSRLDKLRTCLRPQKTWDNPAGQPKGHSRGELALADLGALGPSKEVFDTYVTLIAARSTDSKATEREDTKTLSWDQAKKALHQLVQAGAFFFFLLLFFILVYAYKVERSAQHIPRWERVNMPLANDQGFLRAFQCRRGDPMRPDVVCRFWESPQ